MATAAAAGSNSENKRWGSHQFPPITAFYSTARPLPPESHRHPSTPPPPLLNPPRRRPLHPNVVANAGPIAASVATAAGSATGEGGSSAEKPKKKSRKTVTVFCIVCQETVTADTKRGPPKELDGAMMALLALANGGSGVGLGPANVCGSCLRVVHQDGNVAMASALETLGKCVIAMPSTPGAWRCCPAPPNADFRRPVGRPLCRLRAVD